MSNSSATPRIVAHQAPLSMGFSRQEYQSGLPFPSPGDLPRLGIDSKSSALAGEFFTTEPPGKPCSLSYILKNSSLSPSCPFLDLFLFPLSLLKLEFNGLDCFHLWLPYKFKLACLPKSKIDHYPCTPE